MATLNRPAWWSRRSLIAVLWLPLAGLFFGASALRRLAYRAGWLKSEVLPVPVIVVGNIAAGGSGKTPVVIWLAATLRARGFRPGILSRGYGGTAEVPTSVQTDSYPALVGDEPVLLARRTGCPLWVGRDRVAAGRALLAAHPEVNVLITDDGLQHYRLARSAEIVVIDETILGNAWPLPAGPLREPVSRLASAGLLICNGAISAGLESRLPPVPRAGMLLEARQFYRLGQPAEKRLAADFSGQRLRAVAGIGNPERFFTTLRSLGLTLASTRALPDHHAFTAEDLSLPDGEVLLLTEKDAVKCASLALADAWVLPVEACIDEAALEPLLERLHGPETA
ncbi:tetraacyldisaccharide 4'-kinase [Uliginosibacterium sp. 31-16]|uniref:tetraacyldisaccharide 4'-kinase n=1 Tax=Uliginosibacterium sp. 31-16 TaxID=3068315 RepID=UPI00273EBCD3|nr:tetraacyldisaccharide 4'-kinase [Uliginosibacterium sp. 31-16]MDP5240467.1 tetraacyldisaccharide 4'-kinase [Uliginosibacterium sp. 31-16]